MDLKTQRRINEYKQKQREKRLVQRNLSGMSDREQRAEQRRMQRLKLAKKKRPGFGSSVSSVADHLNEVVGLTERKISRREERDKRIEAAAKSGAGVRRHNAFLNNSSNKSLAPTLGQRLGGTSSRASMSQSPSQRETIARAREAFLERLAQQQAQHEQQ